MIEVLFLSFMMAANPGGAPSDPDSPEAYLEFLLRPEAVQRWQREAVRACAQSTSPAECRPANLAARYSEASLEVCRYIAGGEFRGRHGGTSTSFAQHAIRETCRSSIAFCRSAWQNYDAINFSGRPGQTDPGRVAHFARVLTERCGAEPGVAAPF